MINPIYCNYYRPYYCTDLSNQYISTPIYFGNSQPSADSIQNKETKDYKTLGITALLVTGLAVAADFIFAKGKHVKSLIGYTEKNITKETSSITHTPSANTLTTNPHVTAAEHAPKPKVSEVKQLPNAATPEPIKPQVIETSEVQNAPLVINKPQNITERYGTERIRSLAEYKRGYDQDINQGLRLGKAEESTVRQIDNIDSIIQNSEATAEDILLYRGIRIRQHSPYSKNLGKLKQGDIINEQAYLSTTSDIDIAKEFAKSDGYLFRINVPKGSKCLDVEAFREAESFTSHAGKIKDEKEFILPRGSNVRIKTVTKDPSGRTIIEAEYIDSTPRKINTVKLSSDKAKLDFTLEKIYAHSDSANIYELNTAISKCIKENRIDDVEKLIKIFEDRAITTQDPTILASLINPNNTKHTILKYFDNPSKYNEVIPFLKNMEELVEKTGGCCYINNSVYAVAQELQKMKEPLSEEFTSILRQQGYIW